ncbi:MAG: hypothetical protein AB7F75_00460 [Planctomycetota bacterium]
MNGLEIPLSIPDASLPMSLAAGTLVGALLASLRVRVATCLFASTVLSLLLLTRVTDNWKLSTLISGLETTVFLVDRAILEMETLWIAALLAGAEVIRRVLRAAVPGQGSSVPGILMGYLVRPLSLAAEAPAGTLPEEAARHRWLGSALAPVAPSLPWVASTSIITGLAPSLILGQLWPLPVAVLCGGLVLLRNCQGGGGLNKAALRLLIPALAMLAPALFLDTQPYILCLVALAFVMGFLPMRKKAGALWIPRPDVTAMLVMACALSSLSAYGDLAASGSRLALPRIVMESVMSLGGIWVLGAWSLLLGLVGGSFAYAWFALLPFAHALPDSTGLLVASACAFTGSRLSPVGLLRDSATPSLAIRLALPAIVTLIIIWYLS